MGNIVLNGKLYDSVTGALIHAPTPAPQSKAHKKSGQVIDGVVRGSHKSHAKKKRLTAQPTAKAAVATSPRSTHAPVSAHRHKPQKTATLMRHAVSKPVHQPEHRQPATVRHQRTAERLKRAKAVPKSHHIQRFPASHAAHRTVPKKHAAVAVEAAPAAEPVIQPASTPQQPAETLSASEKLVTNALKHARAHEATHPYAKKPKRRMAHAFGIKHRTANLAMGVLAVVVLTGFFTYQNIPSLSMRVASTRAGFSAVQPNYKPSGFAQDKLVSYSPGKVTISFHSNSDDRSFQVSQQVSNWNSQALADNYLAVNHKTYRTYQVSGKTIYVYEGSNATWVNGGVWYQIQGKSSLNSEQLLKIANSI